MKMPITSLALLLAFSGSTLADCDLASARRLSERHMAALLSSDCEKKLNGISASLNWIRQCRRGLLPPHAEEKAEFARRTTFRFSELVPAGPDWIAVGVLEGPDPAVFESILTSQMLCDATWTAYRPEGQKCGVDWSEVPVTSYEGGVALACEGGRWLVRDPE
jgi:hypothetical protein